MIIPLDPQSPRWAIECAQVLATGDDRPMLAQQLAAASNAYDRGARDELALWASSLEAAWRAGWASGQTAAEHRR